MIDQRWLVITLDGRHATLGRATDPSTEDLERVTEVLRGQGLAGWLAVSEGHYYSSKPLRLLMVRPLVEMAGSTWQEAQLAFIAAREAVLAPPETPLVDDGPLLGRRR